MSLRELPVPFLYLLKVFGYALASSFSLAKLQAPRWLDDEQWLESGIENKSSKCVWRGAGGGAATHAPCGK